MTDRQQFLSRRLRLCQQMWRVVSQVRDHTAELELGPMELEALAHLCDRYELPETARAVRALLPVRQVA